MIKRGAVLVAALVAIKAQALMNDEASELEHSSGSGGAWVSSLFMGTRASAPTPTSGWSRHGAGAALAVLERDLPWRRGGWVSMPATAPAWGAPAGVSQADLAQVLHHTGPTPQRLSDVWPQGLTPTPWWPRTRQRLALPAVFDPPRGAGPAPGGIVPVPKPSGTPSVFYPPPGWGQQPEPLLPNEGTDMGNPLGPAGGGATAPVPEPGAWHFALTATLLGLALSRWRAARAHPSQ